MLRILSIIILILVYSSVEAEELHVKIISPKDQEKVSWRVIIEGMVSDPDVKVWVIIHPMSVSYRWVQPRVSVKANGTWKVIAYIGDPGTKIGEHFEILAVVNPEVTLSEGDMLPDWPKSQTRSNFIEVIRE